MGKQRRTPIRRTIVMAGGIVALLMGLQGARVGAQDDADDAKELTIALDEYKGSGVSGWATLTPTDKGLRVAMAVEGKPVTGNHPTHIHTGTCEDFDPNPLYPLNTVNLDPLSDDGTSKTTVEDVTLDELLDGDYVIVAHKSAEELTNYFVCGEIKASNADTGPRTAGSVAAPNTGVGSAAGTRSPATALVGGLGALVVALAGTGLVRRRRSQSPA